MTKATKTRKPDPRWCADRQSYELRKVLRAAAARRAARKAATA